MKRFNIRSDVVAVALMMVVTLFSGCRPATEELPKPSRLSDLAKPATVLIRTHFRAQVAVPEVTIPDSKMQALLKVVIRKVQRGEVARTEEAMKVAAINEFLAHPMLYVAPSRGVRTVQTGVTAQGSGFIVTPDGYVVTNAHVVVPHESEIKQALAQQGLQQLVMEDVQALVKELEGAVTPEMMERLQRIATDFYEQHMQVTNLEKSIETSMGAVVPGIVTGEKSYPSEVMTAVGEPIPGKDVAILKMEGSDVFPTLPIGDDTLLQTGDRLYVMGYPGQATFHPLISQSSQLEPTFTQGVVSARKTMTGGWEVIQTDAGITHGNSGGPVLDSRGRVIGIATFGTISQTGQELSGLNFVYPTTVIKQFLERNNVKPSESIVSIKYAEALNQYDQKHYKHAMALFQEVNALSPGHTYVQRYITQAQTQITAGQDRSWEESLWIYGVAIGAVLLVIALVAMRRLFPIHFRPIHPPQPQ